MGKSKNWFPGNPNEIQLVLSGDNYPTLLGNVNIIGTYLVYGSLSVCQGACLRL